MDKLIAIKTYIQNILNPVNYSKLLEIRKKLDNNVQRAFKQTINGKTVYLPDSKHLEDGNENESVV